MDVTGEDAFTASGDGVSEESSLNYIALGVGIGVALLVLLVGVVAVVVIMMRWRRRNQRGEWTVPTIDNRYNRKMGLEAGVTNAVYACKSCCYKVSRHYVHILREAVFFAMFCLLR
jgi:hypothetical protein